LDEIGTEAKFDEIEVKMCTPIHGLYV